MRKMWCSKCKWENVGCAFGRGELGMCSKYWVARWEYLWHCVVVCEKKYRF